MRKCKNENSHIFNFNSAIAIHTRLLERFAWTSDQLHRTPFRKTGVNKIRALKVSMSMACLRPLKIQKYKIDATNYREKRFDFGHGMVHKITCAQSFFKSLLCEF